jgi:hypothetical protein
MISRRLHARFAPPFACFVSFGAPVAATAQQITPREYAEVIAQGPSYGFMCDVVAPAGAVVRREMNGAVVGTLRRGTGFLLDAGLRSRVAYDRNRRLWYYVSFVYQSRLRGWVRAADIACRSTSYH